MSSCKKNNSVIKLKKDKNLEYVKLFLDNLFESFADACQDVDHQEQGNWEYWLMTMNENDFFRNNPAFYDVCLNISRILVSSARSGVAVSPSVNLGLK